LDCRFLRNFFAKDIEYDVRLIENDITGWDSRKGDSALKRIMYFAKK
jgi:hypothetical protein